MDDAADDLGSAVDALCFSLSGAGAPWGSDDIGRAFFNGGDGAPGFGWSRNAVLAHLADMVNLVQDTARTLIATGRNFRVAEDASTIGGSPSDGADKDASTRRKPYVLPDVTEGLVESDPPPSQCAQVWHFVETMIGGCQWPDGNMAALTSVREALTGAADAVAGVARDVDAHTRAVTANNSGETVEEFSTFAATRLQGSADQGGLLSLVSTLRGLASSVDFLMKQKNAARLQFELSMAFLGLTWAIALAISWITGGSSIAAAAATTQAEGFVLRKFLLQVAKAMLGGMWFAGGMDAAGQYARIHEGVQEGFNGGEMLTALGQGAIAGAVMGGAGSYVGARSTASTRALSDSLQAGGLDGAWSRFKFAGMTGTAGNIAAQAITEQHVDLGSAAGFGFGMAGMGVAGEAGKHLAGHFTGDHPATNSEGSTGSDVTSVERTDPTVSEHGITDPGDATGEQPPSGVHVDTTQLAENGTHEASQSTTLDGDAVPATGAEHPAAGDAVLAAHTEPEPPAVVPVVHAEPEPPAVAPVVHAEPEPPAPVPVVHPEPESAAPVVSTAASTSGRGPEAGPAASGSSSNIGDLLSGKTAAPVHGEATATETPGGHDANAADPPGQTVERPGPSSPVHAAPQQAPETTDAAHTALTEARQIVAPDGLLLQDGSVRLTDPSGRTVVLPEDVLRHAEDKLANRAADGATADRLRAEAAAWMGAEIARSSHTSPTDGGLEALRRLADRSPESAVIAAALSREIAGARGAEAGSGRLTTGRSAAPDPALRPGLHREAASEIVERARRLTTDPSKPWFPDPAHHEPEASGTTVAVTGRSPHTDVLTLDEVRSALDDLRPSDLGRGVTGWSWSEDGSILNVETESWGVRQIRPVVAEMPESLSAVEPGRNGQPDRLKIAPWAMSKEAAEAAGLPPKAVAEAAQVLPRAWLHGITEIMQRTAAAEVRSGQGLIRRFVSDIRAAVRNEGPVTELINDHRYLAREWRTATDAADRARLALQIRQVGQDLRTHGRTPPEPPWIEGADGGAAAIAEAQTPLSELTGKVREVSESLRRDSDTLAERVATHVGKALDADEKVERALSDASKAAGQHDHGAPGRNREAMKQVADRLREAERHREMARRYQEALDEAVKARTTYGALLGSLDRMATEPQSDVMARVSADSNAQLAESGWRDLATYEESLKNVLPPELVSPEAVLAGPLPLRHSAADTANALLTDAGIDHTFSPESLERGLRAEAPNLLSRDGALLPVGPDGALLRAKLRLNHLVEVPEPRKRPAETAAGGFEEGGQWTGATANHSHSTGYELDLAVLSQLLPDEHPALATVKSVMKMFGPSFERDRGHGWSEVANDLHDARPGAVVNIKGGEVTVIDGLAELDLSVISPDGHETPVTEVTTGSHDDASSARLMVSNANFMEAPKDTVQLPPYDRQRVPLPDHKVVEMNGLEGMLDKTVNSLEGQDVTVGREARTQLRHLLVAEPKDHLKVLAGDHGLLRSVPGTDLIMRLKARFDLNKAELVQTSAVDLMERVDVGFVGTTGSDTYNVSKNISTNVPIKPWSGAADVVPGHAEFKVGLAGKLNGARAVTHTDTVNVGGVTIPVTVARHVGHTELVKFPEGSVVLEAHFYSAKDGRVLDPVTHEVGASIRFPESDAHEYGLPVDAAAYKRGDDGQVIKNADGSPMLRDDNEPGDPVGRKGELPEFVGDGDGQMRGAGHALVSKVTGVEEGLPKIISKLEKLGVLYKTDEHGLPKPSSGHRDSAEVHGQTQARRKLEELVDRVRAHYDQAAQKSGVVTHLTHVRPHAAPEHFTLTTHIEQHFDKYEYKRVDTSKEAVKLDIGSQSSGTTTTKSVTYSGGGGATLGHKPAAHQSGAEEGLGGEGGKNFGHSESVTNTEMVNDVSLTESGAPLADGTMPHTVRHVLRDAKGRTILEVVHAGQAKVEWPVDMLPEADPHPGTAAATASPETAPPTSGKVLERATPQHLDAGDLLDQVESKLFEGRRLPAGVATFLDQRNLITYMDEWLGHGYETSVTVDPHGMQPRRLTLEVHGTVGPSKLLGPIDVVDGKINLTADSVTTTTSRSSGSKVAGSASGSAHHGNDLTDGGNGDLYKTWGRSSSHAETESWGFERLRIGIDPKLNHLATAHLEVVLRDPLTGESERVSVDAPMQYTVPESAALDLHVQGEMRLPMHHMADVMQRFLDGNLRSDEGTAARLAGPYLADVAEAGRAGTPLPALSAGHTPEAFFDKLLSVAPTGPELTHTAAEQGTSKDLVSAHDLAPAGYEVVVADHYQRGMATSLFDEVELFDSNGTKTSIHDAVLRAAGERSPEAWAADPTLRQRLSGKFEGTRWEGFIDEMVDPWGFDRDLRVRTGEAGDSALLNVQVQVGFGDRTTQVGTTKHVVPIFQGYHWKGGTRSETSSGTVGGDIGSNDGSPAGAVNTSAGTARSRSVTGTTGHELTRLKRLRWYDAADTDPAQKGSARVEQPMTVRVTVDQVPLAPGEKAVKGPGDTRKPITIELTGRAVRYLPARMVERVGPDAPGHPPAIPEHPQDLRPVKLPGADYFVESVEGNGAYQVMHDTFVDLLGEKAERQIRRQLALQWSGMARKSPLNFERMIGDEGYQITVTHGRRTATARVHLDMLDLRADHIGGAEVSLVDRSKKSTAYSASTGHRLPATGSVEVKDGTLGLGYKESFGAEAAESISDNSGARIETSDFSETDEAVTSSARGAFTIDVTAGNKHVQRTAQGRVDLTIAGPEFEAVRDRQKAGDPRGPSWNLDPHPKRGRLPSGGQGWNVVNADPARPSAPLTRALLDARLNNTEVRVEVRSEGGVPHRYRALPDGTLKNGDDWTDGGYADAFSSLPPSLVPLADVHGVNLRRVFEQSPVPGSLAEKVRAELTRLGVPLPLEDTPLPLRSPVGRRQPDDSWHGDLPGDGAAAGGGFGGGV